MKQFDVPVPEKGTPVVDANHFRIEITADGPYMVYGRPPIHKYTIQYDEDGNSWSYEVGNLNYISKDEPTTLCRCGHSKNAPYCDGSHINAAKQGEWNPELTASFEAPLNNAYLFDGERIAMSDVRELCAFARFCDAKGSSWNQVENSADYDQEQLAIRTASACPAGRLKIWDKDQNSPDGVSNTYEPHYEPSIGIIEDPKIGVGGPLFIMGGIPIIAPNGRAYEPRNRVTLCRCGESDNKPFCNGNHAPAHWKEKTKK